MRVPSPIIRSLMFFLLILITFISLLIKLIINVYNFNHHRPPLLLSVPSSTPQSSCLCSLCFCGSSRTASPHIASCMPPCLLYTAHCQSTTLSCSSSPATFPLCLKSNRVRSLCCWGCWWVLHRHIRPRHLHLPKYFDSVLSNPWRFFLTYFRSPLFRPRSFWKS